MMLVKILVIPKITIRDVGWRFISPSVAKLDVVEDFSIPEGSDTRCCVKIYFPDDSDDRVIPVVATIVKI